MPAASILIKPASSNCNMDCKYCFYKVLSSNREEYDKGFMSIDTLETLVKEGIRYADGLLTFAFQGGEPTLTGIDFYKKLIELQKKYNDKNLIIENTIQTNGLLIDKEWAQFLGENHFLVGLSLDGPRKINDNYRVDYNKNGTFERIMSAINYLREYNVDFNILTVVTEELAGKAGYLYKFYKRNKFEYVQFIPCMDEVNRGKECERQKTDAPVTALSYGKFLCEIFDLWYDDFMNGDAPDIRMFSNLAQMAAGYPAEECGMNGCCSCYFVVEGDGSIYPCDFFCTDEWKLGEVGQPFSELIQSDKAISFTENSMTDNEKCKECRHFSLCHGGCRRWREDGTGHEGINRLCEGYQLFFDHTKDRIMELGKIIIRRMGRPSGV